MPQYLSPGVYVEEVPSAVQPIAGVGTSTAGFIGIAPNTITVPVSSSLVTGEAIGTGDAAKTAFNLKKYPVNTTAGTFQIRVNGSPVAATLANDDATKVSQVTFSAPPANNAVITGDYVGEYKTTAFAPADGQHALIGDRVPRRSRTQPSLDRRPYQRAYAARQERGADQHEHPPGASRDRGQLPEHSERHERRAGHRTGGRPGRKERSAGAALPQQSLPGGEHLGDRRRQDHRHVYACKACASTQRPIIV